jgi:hypothetical protein
MRDARASCSPSWSGSLPNVNWYLFWNFVHFAGIVVFVGGHGVSASVTLRLPRERDPARLEPLLGLSRSTIVWSNVGLLLLVIGGVANWVSQDYSPLGWLWASWGSWSASAAVASGAYPADPSRDRVERRGGLEAALMRASATTSGSRRPASRSSCG